MPEVIAEYDPFLSDHISRHGNKGSGHPSYFSKFTCYEFIHLMAQTVKSELSRMCNVPNTTL